MANPLWTWEREIELEKEQIYQADIAVGDVRKKLEFRWTLYKNHGLVMHIRYDEFNHQEVLYTDHQRNAYKIALGRGKSRDRYTPYFVLYFKDFKDKKAYFKAYIDGVSAMVLEEDFLPTHEQINQSRLKAQENK